MTHLNIRVEPPYKYAVVIAHVSTYVSEQILL